MFDPSSPILGISFNWLRAILFIIFIKSSYWLLPNQINSSFLLITKTLHIEFKTLLGAKAFKGRSWVFISLLLFILFNNFLGLFPYIFTASRHITFTINLSLPLWLAFIIFGWVNYTKYIFAHLVPQRTPGALIPFMVLIESIRNVIRPLTLAIRLIANIVAGHLLITLLGNQTALASSFILAVLIGTQTLLLLLESAVSIIQSYVFAVLSTLYAREITSH